jgi:hypothetical protein
VDELLFSREELRLALDEELTHLQAAVEAEPEEILQQADEEEWAAALSEHFAVACPILNADETWMEPVQETTMDVSWDRGRFFSDYNSSLARNFPAYKVVVHIPFEGDSEVFHLRPSSFTLNPPRARVTKDDLLLAIVYPRGPAAGYRRPGSDVHQLRGAVARFREGTDRTDQHRTPGPG